MTQRSSSASRIILWLGLLFVGAFVAVPRLDSPPRHPNRPRPQWIPTEVATTLFGQPCEPVARFAAAEAQPSFWLEGEPGFYLPASTWEYTELTDGSARTSCLFTDSVDPSKRWWLEARLMGRASSEAEEGGAFVWERMLGTLRGHGAYQGALLELREERDFGLRVGQGASDMNLGYGMQGRFSYHVVSAPDADAEFVGRPGRGGFRARLSTDDMSTTASSAGEAVLALPGIGKQLVFVAGGSFEQHADGSARLSGLVARDGDREVTFQLEVAFAGACRPGEEAYPPQGSPTHALASSNYTQYGGPIDDQTWRYYTSMSGTLRGLGEYAGALVQLESEGPAFQLGVGAGGDTSEMGASCWVRATTTRQPHSEARLIDEARGALQLQLGRGSVQFAAPAMSSSASHPGAAFNLELPGLGHDFVFTSGGQFAEQPDGSARLTGTLTRSSRPQMRLFADLAFSHRHGGTSVERDPGFRASRELHSWAYLEGGGVVDPGTWHAFTNVSGELYGLGALEGARYEVSRGRAGLQVGVGASGRNLGYGGSGQLVATRTATPFQGAAGEERIVGEVAFDLDRELRESVFGARQELALEGVRRDGALRIEGLGNDFGFVSGGELIQRADGSAQLSGVVARRSFPQQRFLLEAQLDQRRDPAGAGYPPAGSPKVSLPAEFLAHHGGVVRPGSWTFYERCEGRLLGLDDFAGARLSFRREGPAFQLGVGANNRNPEFGAAGWIALEVEEAPRHASDFPMDLTRGELSLEPRREFSRRAEEAIAIAAVQLPAGHALSLPGLATDLVFPRGGEFREFEDGTASLTGKVARATDPTKSFDVLLDFKQRVDPGFGNYPPQGSPALELPSTAYTEHGGVVDPERWHYFQSIEGILVGTGEWAGSLLEVRDLGGAAQVGYGANGRNFEHGASAVLDVKVVRPPGEADSWPEGHLQGRLDIDLESAGF